MPPPNALTIRATDRPRALPTIWADAAEATNDNVLAPIRARLAEERAKSVAMGLLDPETGLPTAAGLKQAALAYAQGMGDSGGVNALTGMIRAYHGSPHMFDRFDLSKIGTGEGAQAYGHGLYFAEKEATARGYRDTLTNKWKGADWDNPEVTAAYWLDHFGDRDKAISYIKKVHYNNTINGRPSDTRALDILESGREPAGRPPPQGHIYEVNINAEPGQLLDWDKLLTEQPRVIEPIKQAAQRNLQEWKGPTNLTAKDIVSGNLKDLMGIDALGAAGALAPGAEGARGAARLRDAGIPGIQYLDAGSRGAGEGSRNYVIFDDKLIDIMRRYGLPGVVTGGAAFAPDYTGRYTEQ